MTAVCFYLVRSGVLEREFEGEVCAFARNAVHFYLSMVCFDDGFDIAKAQAKALDVMKVTGMGPVEFLEDTALRLLAHAYAVVFDTDDQVFLRAMGNDADKQVLPGVFDGIVDEVGNDIRQVDLIGFEQIIFGVQL